MAPGRRKGSGRAAAAAAQQQQWKVGDLVLAKMKGFPAWPAMISEPEKWGFSSVRKKLLVYFYGTKQIAFCNYADIEAFTEEKKKSLLIKRQGKGADFVRAVDEIIDVYENTKKQNNSGGDEAIVPNAGNLDFPTSNFTKKSPELTPDVVQNHKAGGLCASAECHDIHSSEEKPVTSVEVDPHNVNPIINESIEEVSILDHLRKTPLATSTTSWKKRSRDAPMQAVVVQRRMPSLRRSRSSSIGETPKFQESAMLLNDSDTAAGNLIPDALQEEPTQRTNLGNMEQPSDVPDVVVPVSASLPLNDSSKEFVSEIAVLKFEANNLTEGSALESCSKLEVSANGCLGKEERLSKKLDLPLKAAICKKKRKPNRKRVVNITECASFDKEEDLQVELSGNLLESQNSHNEMNEGFPKADGDKHLPLVKRARVRMGKPPIDEAQLDEFAANNKKSEAVVFVHKCESQPTSTSPGNDCLANGMLGGGKEDLDLSNDCSLLSRKDLMFWKVKKYQLKGLTLDAEAALPPSKRLNRALEAMSANAADGTNDCPGGMISNGCLDSPKTSPLHPSSDIIIGSATRLRSIQYSDNNTLDSNALCSENLDAPTLASSEKKCVGILPGDYSSPKDTHCNEILVEPKNYDLTSLSKMADMDIHDKSPQPHLFRSIEKQVNAASCQSLPHQFSSSVEKINGSEILRTKEEYSCLHVDSASEYGAAELPMQKVDSVLKNEGRGDSFPPDIADGTVSTKNVGSAASDTSGPAKSSGLHSGEDTRTSAMQYLGKEIKYKVTVNERCTSPDMTPMKDLIAAAQAKRLLSRSTSFSDNCLDSKVVREAVTSPAPFQKEENSGQCLSPKPLMKPAYYTDDMTGNLPNSSSSPHACLQERSINKFAGHAEANAARRAFEATLCTLSRTKESIGRATRHAIECAKYGIAGEVVEILLQNLERESILYKRVDLFFLVDSITQCSRSQKGGAGDVYPSLVQSVLPRLLCAASPPGNAASENRRQCLKVLRLWLERKTLPESIIRQHIRELDSANEASLASAYSRRPSRTERALHDPVREMEGMLVDEYGSNTSFRLPGLLHANVLEDDEDSVSDEKSFEAVTPERHAEVDHEEGTEQPSTEKHRHILEDVDGELEMEDVAPPCDVEVTSTPHVSGSGTVCNNHQLEEHHSSPFAPPLPEETPPSQPPLPSSPPPVVAPSSTVHSVIPHHQSGSVATPADTADLHNSIVTHNMQNQQCQSIGQHPSNLNGNAMSMDSVSYYAPGYGGPPKQMLPPVSTLGPSSFGNLPFTHPVGNSTNNIHTFNSALLPNKAYHLQHPLPTVSNQFSYAQTEPQQRAQPWGNSSSFTERFQYGHDIHRGNLYGYRGPNGPIQHDVRERSRFSPGVHSGPSLSHKVEAPPSSSSHYGQSMEPLPATCPGWPPHPRMSDYSASASRSSVEAPITEVAGAHVYWRPR